MDLTIGFISPVNDLSMGRGWSGRWCDSGISSWEVGGEGIDNTLEMGMFFTKL